MFKLFVLVCFLVSIVNVNAENSTQTNRTSGKTFLFQVRRSDNGNGKERSYRIVNNRNDNINNDDSAPDDSAPEEFTENLEPPRKATPFDSLKNRRRNYSRLERYRNANSAHLVDPEWHFNVNNQHVEVPEIANYMYSVIDEETEGLENVSTIRFIFESHMSEDNILEFNLESLENRTDEYLLNAELLIYRFSETNDTDGKEKIDEVIRLYQVLDINDSDENSTSNPDLHKLLNVIYLSSQNTGWQGFKVRNIVENWLDGVPNLGFLLTATDSWETPIDLNIGRKFHGKFQPILVISLGKYERRAVQIPHLSKPNKKQVQEYVNLRSNMLPTRPSSGCTRQIWYVSFQELGWNNFILQPSGFMAFQCRGSCAHPVMSSTTNHALFKQIFHSFVNVKKPCCVPDTYQSLPIMFIDANQNIVIKIYDDMVVDSCACR